MVHLQLLFQRELAQNVAFSMLESSDLVTFIDSRQEKEADGETVSFLYLNLVEGQLINLRANSLNFLWFCFDWCFWPRLKNDGICAQRQSLRRDFSNIVSRDVVPKGKAFIFLLQ